MGERRRGEVVFQISCVNVGEVGFKLARAEAEVAVCNLSEKKDFV